MIMNETEEFICVRNRVNELMAGGVFGDGIGPGNTARTVNAEFGTSYRGEEIWRIWRQGKEWADPRDDVYPI